MSSAFQNRLWTWDRPGAVKHARGDRTAFTYWYTVGLSLQLMNLAYFATLDGVNLPSTSQWSSHRVNSLIVLVAWEIWKETDARIFYQHRHTMADGLISKSNEEARLACSRSQWVYIIPLSWAEDVFLSLVCVFLVFCCIYTTMPPSRCTSVSFSCWIQELCNFAWGQKQS